MIIYQVNKAQYKHEVFIMHPNTVNCNNHNWCLYKNKSTDYWFLASHRYCTSSSYWFILKRKVIPVSIIFHLSFVIFHLSSIIWYLVYLVYPAPQTPHTAQTHGIWIPWLTRLDPCHRMKIKTLWEVHDGGPHKISSEPKSHLFQNPQHHLRIMFNVWRQKWERVQRAVHVHYSKHSNLDSPSSYSTYHNPAAYFLMVPMYIWLSSKKVLATRLPTYPSGFLSASIDFGPTLLNFSSITV